jgi:hypothetical protein
MVDGVGTFCTTPTPLTLPIPEEVVEALEVLTPGIPVIPA